MPLDVERYRKLLRDAEADLLTDLERTGSDARETPSAEVEDPIDLANTEMSKDLVSREGDRDFEKLQLVREALARIDDGTYGKCLVCGREIPEARLQAVPWTPFCVEDQEKREPKFTPATM